jgi:peptidoglycan/LPS O-acetylase OafA/YrhL
VTTTTALRVARLAELVYAIVAVVLAFGIPLPPRGPGMVLFAHWLGTALLAGAIALRLARPNRQTWYVAALLAGYVLFNAGVALARLLGPESATLGRPGLLAVGVGAILWVTQIIVAGCLYQAREIRTMPTAAPRHR